MEQRLSVVTLGTRDLGRALRFYEGLGWKRANAHEEVAFFQLNGLVLALFGREDLAKDAGLDAEGAGFSGIALAHNARHKGEVDAVIATAKAAGGRVVKPAQDTFWGGYAGYFADPDGHLWEVAWNPGWPIGEDGSVSLPD
jgi:catechol 2,3-dioxygenase-like lactoylglutathione lyase family enzyme